MKHVKLKHEYQGQSTQKTLYNNKINLLTDIVMQNRSGLDIYLTIWQYMIISQFCGISNYFNAHELMIYCIT